MTAKQRLHGAIDGMTEDEAVDWLLRVQESRPFAPLTPAQIAMIERGIADVEAGRVVPQEEVLRRLGVER